MRDQYEAIGYENAVLHSGDDYEPYGYLPPEQRLELRQVEFGAQTRDASAERVIEAQLLADWSMVGC